MRTSASLACSRIRCQGRRRSVGCELGRLPTTTQGFPSWRGMEDGAGRASGSSDTVRPPVLPSGNSRRSSLTCSRLKSLISDIRQPVSSSRRKAATADGISVSASRNLAEPRRLFRRQEALALVFPVAPHVAARVGAARAPAPDLGQGEDLRRYPRVCDWRDGARRAYRDATRRHPCADRARATTAAPGAGAGRRSLKPVSPRAPHSAPRRRTSWRPPHRTAGPGPRSARSRGRTADRAA